MPRIVPMFLTCLLGAGLLAACDDDDDGPVGPSPNPTITAVTPAQVGPGDTLTVTGSNFGSDAARVTVSIGGVAAQILSVSPTTILATVPAALQPGATTLQVTVAGASASATADITIVGPQPVISGFQPDTAVAGDTLTILGENFGVDIGVATVTIGDVAAQILSVADSVILVQVPGTLEGTFSIVVTVAGSASEALELTVVSVGPPPATATILGRITTVESAEPVGGAQVRVNAFGDTIPVFSVTSDAEGNYRIEGISPGTYIVIAGKEGFDTASTTVTLEAGESRTVDLALGPELLTGTIFGRVTNAATESGIPAAEVLVIGDTVPVLGDTIPLFTTTSDSFGNYSIPDVEPGTYLVIAQKAGFNPLSTQVQVVAGQLVAANFALTPSSASVAAPRAAMAAASESARERADALRGWAAARRMANAAHHLAATAAAAPGLGLGAAPPLGGTGPPVASAGRRPV